MNDAELLLKIARAAKKIELHCSNAVAKPWPPGTSFDDQKNGGIRAVTFDDCGDCPECRLSAALAELDLPSKNAESAPPA